MLREELRTVIRGLVASWSYTAVAVLTLAVGLGVCTMVFSIVEAVVINPLPLAETDGLVEVREFSRFGREASSSYADVSDWAEASTAVEEFALYRDRDVVAVVPGGAAEEVAAEAVSANLFTLLRVAPALGRVFATREQASGASRVVVLSHRFWIRRFAASGEAVGSSMLIDSEPHTVIGVMPRGFGFPDNQLLWIPLDPGELNRPRDSRRFRVIARLAENRTIEVAQTELRVVVQRLAEEYPVNEGRGVRLVAFRDALPAPIRTALWVTLAAVVFVLMIACANVTALAMTRHWARQRHSAIRLALGASRWHLVRLVLVESVLIGLLGGLAAMPLVYGGFAFVRWLVPFDLPMGVAVGVNANVVLFTALVSVGAGVLFGSTPMLLHGATGEAVLLRDGVPDRSEDPRREWARNALLVGQLAMSTVLLISALLLVRSLRYVHAVDPGFNTENLLTARVISAGAARDSNERIRFFEQLLVELERLPGIGGVAATTAAPLRGRAGRVSVSLGVAEEANSTQLPSAEYRGVSATYGQILGIRAERGRWMTRYEAESHAAVAVINRSLAARLWPEASPIGREMQIGDVPHRVVGVVPDVPRIVDGEELIHQVFVPLGLTNPSSLTFVVSTSDLAATARMFRSAVAAADPGAPISGLMSMDQFLSEAFWRQRMFGGLFILFAAIASFLAVLGVYGTVSYTTSIRAHEVSIRMALGATARRVVLLFMKRGAIMAATGLAIGVIAAAGVSRLLQSLLLGVGSLDPPAFSFAILLLGGAAVLAAYVPSRRAAREGQLRPPG